MIQELEQKRLNLSRSTNSNVKARLGQFFTPAHTAEFMAGFFSADKELADCRLLDAGAGIGSLSAAFLRRWKSGEFNFKSVALDAFEYDDPLIPHLNETLANWGNDSGFSYTVHMRDFITAAVESLSEELFAVKLPSYSHAILNPPYKKIRNVSPQRLSLRRVGIQTVNLYSAFVALSIGLMREGGQVVAIIPRSFCNGPYYRPFRDWIYSSAAIRRIHLFDSRTKAFKDDNVLQENVIIHLEKGGQQTAVTISTSTDDKFEDVVVRQEQFDRIVHPDDPEKFIHIPSKSIKRLAKRSAWVSHSLSDLGLKISTGPVVDYRLKNYLIKLPQNGNAPLLYPAHFTSGDLEWPRMDIKKPNAIEQNPETLKWLYPSGFYCVVRRFSSKEEKRRIVASVIDPAIFGSATMIGIENHLNVFHQDKRGLPEEISRGLAVFLNSTPVDEYFRSFNGHTQVNATDLKLMKYPHFEDLARLGRWGKKQVRPCQAKIDQKVREITG